MAVYAIGDIQGCYDELRALLDGLRFDPAHDRLWFVGDLVNRGPASLEVLRFVRGLGTAATVVLGNHDLHLLALASGQRAAHKDPTLEPVLRAPDREPLLDWLRHQPLLHTDRALGFTMLHAGLPPSWTLEDAQALAAEVEAVLRSPQHPAFFAEMYGNKPKRWDAALQGMDRLRFITNCLTRLRFCDAEGRLALKEKGPPGSEKAGLMPWYTVPGRASRGERLLFGHWSTLGYLRGPNVWGLDSGCLWGGDMTALRIDLPTPLPTHHPCTGQANPAAFV